MWKGIDKRRFPRAEYNCNVTLHKPKGSLMLTTHTENISSGGICISSDKPLDIFSEVDLELELEPGSPPVKCNGSVVWSIKRTVIGKEAKQKYDAGIEFLDIKQGDRDRVEKIVEKIIEKFE